MQDNNNTESDPCKEYEVLQKELAERFQPKKQKSLLLSESYNRLNLNSRAYRVQECGTYLEFRAYQNGDQRLSLANFCKDRLCPMCSWRRSLKVFGQLSKVMEVVRKDYEFLFLTLSMKNCKADDLQLEVTKLLRSYLYFTRMTDVKNAFDGLFRSLEITRDTEPIITNLMWFGSKKAHRKPKAQYYSKLGLSVGDPNPNFDTYNAHLHVVTAVKPTYFKSRHYISQEKLIQLWRFSCKVDYDPTAHIQKISQKGIKDINEINISAAIAEVAKYSVKSSDYIVSDKAGNVNIEITDGGVLSFLGALSGRRLYSYSGIFKKVASELGITEDIDSDLINTEAGELSPELSYMILKYSWKMGSYCLVSKDRHTNIDIFPDEL